MILVTIIQDPGPRGVKGWIERGIRKNEATSLAAD